MVSVSLLNPWARKSLMFYIRDAVIVLITRLERTVQELANSHAGLVAALVVGAVLAFVFTACCWAVRKCTRSTKRLQPGGGARGAVRRLQPGGEARGAVALEMEPIVAVIPAPPPAPEVVAVVPAPPPAPEVVAVVPAPPPAPEVVAAPGEVAAHINAVAGALAPDELQAVIAALRAVPRGGPPAPPPMGLRLAALGHPPYVSGFPG